jgi:hypothetical protein
LAPLAATKAIGHFLFGAMTALELRSLKPGQEASNMITIWLCSTCASVAKSAPPIKDPVRVLGDYFAWSSFYRPEPADENAPDNLVMIGKYSGERWKRFPAECERCAACGDTEVGYRYEFIAIQGNEDPT